MTLGVWVLVAAAVVAIALGSWRASTNGVFRGTRRVRRSSRVGGFETGAGRLPQPSVELPQAPSVLAGTTYDGQRGERATLLQFSSAFCAPCRSTRRILSDVANRVPGVRHIEVDAEHHLDVVRRLSILRTPTTLVLDADGREVSRASGAPTRDQVLVAVSAAVSD
jgi:thiol-disulfide isomerase/thioredoxin